MTALNQFPGSSFTSSTNLVLVNEEGTTLGYRAASYGISPSTVDNGPALNTLLSTVQNAGGGRILFQPGTYNFRTPISYSTNGTGGYAVELIGAGKGATFFAADDSLGNIGDLISLNKVKGFKVFDVTLTALSQRSAGSLVKVTGDTTIGATPSTELENIVFERVDMRNGYDGVTLVDGAGSKGVCSFWWRGPSIAKGFAAGGTVVNINTPNGVVINFEKLTHHETTGVAAGSRPFATMRVQGVADLRCSLVESVYARNGLVVDSTVQANTLWMDSCIWGSVTDTCVSIAPSGGSCFGLKFVNNWCDSGTGFIINSSLVHDVVLEGLTVGTCTDGLKISGAASVIGSADILGGCTRGLYLTGSCTDINLRVAFGNRGSANTTGWQADAGVARFALTTVGETLCTTGHTDNSGAVTKSLVNM